MSIVWCRAIAAALLACAALQGCAAAAASSPANAKTTGTLPKSTPGAPLAIPELDAAGHEQLGDRYAGQGALDRAYLEYRESLRLEPLRSSVRYKSARVLLRRGLIPEAREEFARILDDKPDDPLALLGMGHALVLSGDPGAEAMLRSALTQDPKLWQAHHLLGLHYARQGLADEAISEFKAALALNPAEGSVANNLGVVQLQSGHLEDAAVSFRNAIESGCRDPKAANNLGLTLARLGRRDEALKAFRQGGTAATAWNNLGVVLFVEGRRDESLEAFRKAIETESGYYQRAHDNLRRALGSKGTPASAQPTP